VVFAGSPAASGMAWARGGMVSWVWRQPRRDDLATFGAFAVAVAVYPTDLLHRALQAKSRQRRNAIDERAVNRLTGLLADAVQEQWTRAASDRGLLARPL